MIDYKVSARIDLDRAQRDWDAYVAMADTAGAKVKKALKPSGEVSTEKRTKETEKTTAATADLDKRTAELIERMKKLTRQRQIDNVAVAKAQREVKELSKDLRKAGSTTAGYKHQLDKLK